MKNKKRENFKIIDNDEDFTKNQIEEEVVDDFGTFEDSEDDLPVIVNEKEFLSEINREASESTRPKSLSPPRRTVDFKEEDDSEVVYRNKAGKRITRDEWLLLNQKKGKHEKAPKQELVWGKGLVQKELEEEKLKNEQKIINDSFQKYDIDEDYDEELKRKVLWNDPIQNSLNDTNTENSENKIRSKFRNNVVNRFNIEPGYRWDGVIRGNNYEERWFQARADEKYKNKQAYLENVSNL